MIEVKLLSWWKVSCWGGYGANH